MFGERLKEARKRMKLTQTELGQRIGVGKTTISEWEKGNHFPNDIEIVRELASHLDVSAPYLLEDEFVQIQEKTAPSEDEAVRDEYDAIVVALMDALRGAGRLEGDDLTHEQLTTLKGVALILDASFSKLQ